MVKNLLLINSDLSNYFQSEAIENVNYLQNKLSTKNKNHKELISKKSWIKKK